MKKDARLAIRINKQLLKELNKHARNANMTLHDFIMIRCATPKDRNLQMDIEVLKHEGEVGVND